jgi:hypothetical protein
MSADSSRRRKVGRNQNEVGHVLEALSFCIDDRPGIERHFYRRVSEEGPLGQLSVVLRRCLPGLVGRGYLVFSPGAVMGGVYWLPFLIVGLIFALLLAAVVSPFPQDTTVQLLERGEKSPEKRKRMVLGIYFWLLIFALVVLIVTRYF